MKCHEQSDRLSQLNFVKNMQKRALPTCTFQMLHHAIRTSRFTIDEYMQNRFARNTGDILLQHTKHTAKIKAEKVGLQLIKMYFPCI